MRLIDAEALPHDFTVPRLMDSRAYFKGVQDVFETIDAAPTVEAVAVVRCRDCKNSNKIAGNETMRHCWNLRGKSNGSGFSMVCNYGYCDEGERKEDAE
jgi:hypothetical protein